MVLHVVDELIEAGFDDSCSHIGLLLLDTDLGKGATIVLVFVKLRPELMAREMISKSKHVLVFPLNRLFDRYERDGANSWHLDNTYFTGDVECLFSFLFL